MPTRRRTLRNLSSVTARTRRLFLPLQNEDHLLAPEQVIASPETQIHYRIERLLGRGGFGQVYLAKRLGRSTNVPKCVCIKGRRKKTGHTADSSSERAPVESGLRTILFPVFLALGVVLLSFVPRVQESLVLVRLLWAAGLVLVLWQAASFLRARREGDNPSGLETLIARD